MTTAAERLSVIIPARNEADRIGRTVRAVLVAIDQIDAEAEVIVVDDGSRDATGPEASRAGARVVRRDGAGNPGAARNHGAEEATGAVLVFLDADCVPAPGWLATLVAAHEAGARCVGGSLALAPDLPWTARWDYYFSSYHLHPDRPGGPVANHTPANLSVMRDAFDATSGFTESHPVADGHEELMLQGALRRSGSVCHFEPAAVVYHHNRPGLGNLLRRTYRWAYSSIQAKAESGAGRWSWLYRHPWLLVVAAPLIAPLQALYIAHCWMRAGRLEPLAAFPVLLLARFVYAGGTMIGGWRWLTSSPRVHRAPGRSAP